MNLLYYPVTYGIKGIIHLLSKVDDAQLQRVPDKGPLILICNHVNFLDAPATYTHLLPRPISTLAKQETWDNPGLRFLINVWEYAIPIQRGVIDRTAMQMAQKHLAAGRILALSMEGTRSGSGKLQKGHSGVVLLAANTGVPLLPVVYYGHEYFWNRLARFERPHMHFVVGNPFRLELNGNVMSREVRENAVAEIMYQMAALLPSEYRGVYSDFSKASEEQLCFEPGVESNLQRA